MQRVKTQGPPGLAVGLAVLAVLAVAASLACGRPASQTDCDVIVNRNIEVQLKALGVTDPAAVQKRTEELRAQMKDDIEKCVGKRITDGMIACVRKAESAEQIDKCVR